MKQSKFYIPNICSTNGNNKKINLTKELSVRMLTWLNKFTKSNVCTHVGVRNESVVLYSCFSFYLNSVYDSKSGKTFRVLRSLDFY